MANHRRAEGRLPGRDRENLVYHHLGLVVALLFAEKIVSRALCLRET